MMDIRKFQNSFTFLQQYYEHRKKHDPHFSYESWAQELRVKNRSYLRLVVIGERPINEKMLQAFIAFFPFSDDQIEYFKTLVSYTQSRTLPQRQLFGRKLMSLNPLNQDRIEAEQQFDFLSDTLLPRLQTICGFEDAPQDAETIAQICGIEMAEVHQKLAKLEQLGLLKDGKPLKRNWKVPASSNGLGLREFYRLSLQEAASAMDLPFSERKFRSLMIAMDAAEFADFQKDFEIFAQEQLRKRGPVKLSGRKLYQLNFNFFPVTRDLDTQV